MVGAWCKVAMLAADAAALLAKGKVQVATLNDHNLRLRQELRRYKTVNAMLKHAMDVQLEMFPELKEKLSSTASTPNSVILAQACDALRKKLSSRVGNL